MTKTFRPREAAEVIQTTTDRILDAIAAGELVAFDIGRPGAKRRTWRIDADELDRWIASRSTRPTPAPTKRRKRQAPYVPIHLK